MNTGCRLIESAVCPSKDTVDCFKYRSLFEDAPVGYHEIDTTGRIMRINRAECAMLGFTTEEMVGRPIWEFVCPEERDASRAAIERKMASQGPLTPFERTYVRRDGQHVIVQIHENRIIDREGKLAGVRSTVLDVTERKRAEDALARKAAELERSNAELEQFAYIASHDLQEPLRMVASFTQLLARRYRGKLGEDADDFISFAVDGARRMQELINDLLTYSRVGKGESQWSMIDAAVVVNQVVSDLRSAIEHSGARISIGQLPVVFADAFQMRQVFHHLIGNAIKFRNGAAPVISVSGEETSNEWRFRVEDNGIGIDSRHGERIFQIFQRLNSRAQYSGTGIGLAICKKVVERHGGRIWVAPASQGGSIFHFTIGKQSNRLS